jgi:maltooligosyltrehalose trehalohydrolase
MSEVRVWAPEAHSVQLRVGRDEINMQPADHLWWRADTHLACAGADYSFVVDNSDHLPDPRSPSQPFGVQGPSRFVDHSEFPWTDRGWQAPPLSSAVIYELHIGTFTSLGTFESAIGRLDDLVALGITHVELMPVAEFSGDWGWGYDAVDLFAPHHSYGGPDGLKRFVDACHARRLAVLIDVVYNHLGPAGNYLSRFGPYFTDKYSTPWGEAINFDGPQSLEVRRFFCDNAMMWLRDYHCDGLRLDAVHAIYDSSAIHFLAQLADEVAGLAAHLGRNFVLIAESDWNNPRVVTAREAGGYGIDAQWSDDFHHALHAALTGERAGYYLDFGSLADIAKAMTNAFVYDGRYSRFRDRIHGARPLGLSGARFLGYIQTHDQIGNRAQGERIEQLAGLGKAKIAAALVLLGPFIPMLFQGEEFAASSPFQYFTHHNDPELARAVTEGRRREFEAFGWKPDQIPDPQDPATFQRSKLDWTERSREPHAGMLDWYRKLIALRRAVPELTDGRLDRVKVEFDEQAQWIVVRRGSVGIICNLSKARQSIPSPLPSVVLASSDGIQINGQLVELARESVAIVATRNVQETFAERATLTRDTKAAGLESAPFSVA